MRQPASPRILGGCDSYTAGRRTCSLRPESGLVLGAGHRSFWDGSGPTDALCLTRGWFPQEVVPQRAFGRTEGAGLSEGVMMEADFGVTWVSQGRWPAPDNGKEMKLSEPLEGTGHSNDTHFGHLASKTVKRKKKCAFS